MARFGLRPLAAAVALGASLALAACSMFRDYEERPLAAPLNGDDGRLAFLVSTISEAAAPDPPLITIASAAPPVAAAPILAVPGDPFAQPLAQPLGGAIQSRSVLFALHIASYRTESSAAAGWRIIAAEAPETLDDLHPRIETVDLGSERGVYLRLKAGPLDSRDEAVARCAALVEAGHYCQTADFEGRELAG